MLDSVSVLKSAIQCKCPRCHVGKLFIVKNPYNLSKFSQMEESCPNCKLIYNLEQGFWYGALYFSYGIGVAIAIPIMLFMAYFTSLSIPVRGVVITLVLVGLLPILFRLSRSIWIHVFVREDKSYL